MSDIHAVCWHLLKPNRLDPLSLDRPSLPPNTLTLVEPVETELSCRLELTLERSIDNITLTLPKPPLILTDSRTLAIAPAPIRTAMLVSENQKLVPKNVAPMGNTPLS